MVRVEIRTQDLGLRIGGRGGEGARRTRSGRKGG